MRLDKPIGIWLVFFPAAWAVSIAAPLSDIPWLVMLMLVGATLTRSAGCIINDLTDRALDAKVARTQNRPLASGRVPHWQAFVLLLFLLLLALLLALSLPQPVLSLALIAVPMIITYPWMKRITWWPQLFLGLTFNLSALIGWAATGTPLMLASFTLYAAAVLWTLGYDTIYAVQDIKDDALIGIRSSARAVGRQLKPFVAACYGAMFLLLAATGLLIGAHFPYTLGIVAAFIYALTQIRKLPVPAARAGALFRSNQWLGVLILAGILIDRLL
jgi:4-hydroxybenzoate polyprenyltransferase